jgi:hypothetical protein
METRVMTARPTIRTSTFALIVSMAWTASAHAQAGATWTAAVPAPHQVDVDILAGPLDLGGTPVKGAPYSAEAVTEVVQTLADGNRIVRSSSTAVYRDAAGRTRREQGLAVIGPLVAAPEQQKQVIITDPEKGVTFILDPATRTARQMPVLRFSAGPAGGVAIAAPPLPPGVAGPPPPVTMPLPPPTGDVLFFQSIDAAAMPAGGTEIERRVLTRRAGDGPAPVSEPLGTQTIEGVLVEGTRTTSSIPAGQIGNERPIDMVSERWFSPELKALVLSRQSDPRFGETTYRLSSIARGDPDPSLFEVPSDYTIVEPGAGRGGLFFRGRTP